VRCAPPTPFSLGTTGKRAFPVRIAHFGRGGGTWTPGHPAAAAADPLSRPEGGWPRSSTSSRTPAPRIGPIAGVLDLCCLAAVIYWLGW